MRRAVLRCGRNSMLTLPMPKGRGFTACSG
nr:MAG TPA: hypothetical protein [Caudoviricetes sp.]